MNKKRKQFGWCLFILSFLLIVFGIYSGVFSFVETYDTKVMPVVYLNELDISDKSIADLDDILKNIEDELMKESLILIVAENEFEYSFEELNIKVNAKKVKNAIFEYQDSFTFFEKIKNTLEPEEKTFFYELVYDDEKIEDIIAEIKMKVDRKATLGGIVVEYNRNVFYRHEVASYELNLEESIAIVKEKIFSGEKIKLIGIKGKVKEDILSTIDTKVSSYKTWFDTSSVRATNLRVALSDIDGEVLLPGEVFSFYKYIQKKPYDLVDYHGVYGSGICQIASTLYNAELLAGLETVERYQHGNEMPYVLGGLDATVNFVPSAFLDFKFKNVYEYPIYISAYVENSNAVIELWSNSDAKKGHIYELESVPLGMLGYDSYRYTYQNGKLINKEFLGRDWYYYKVFSV